MNTRFLSVPVLVACLFLSGCFATMPSRTDAQGRPVAGSTGAALSGEVKGGAVGMALGTILVPRSPVAGAIILGVVGSAIGAKADERRAAVGSTTCVYDARKSGKDNNGSFNQGVSSSKTVTGYATDCGK